MRRVALLSTGAVGEAAWRLLTLLSDVAPVRATHDDYALPGVDVLWVGQFDLSIAMGIPGAFDDTRMVEAEDRVLAACADAGIAAGVLVGSVDVARSMLARGFRMVALGSDIDLYGGALRAGLEALRDGG